MKAMVRALFPLLILLAFAIPLRAQNPSVVIRLDASTTTSEYCVKGSLKNLTFATVDVSYIELWVFDANTCKRVCVTRKVINQKIKSCDTLDFDLCCKNY